MDVGGRHATSYVHRLASDGRLSLVAVRISTGRTHQIRVHLQVGGCTLPASRHTMHRTDNDRDRSQHLGFPILGDPTYGDQNWNNKEVNAYSDLQPQPLPFECASMIHGVLPSHATGLHSASSFISPALIMRIVLSACRSASPSCTPLAHTAPSHRDARFLCGAAAFGCASSRWSTARVRVLYE